MIEINLLPQSMRKVEGTPLPRFIAFCLGVVLVCSLGAVIGYFQLKVIPDELKVEKEHLDKKNNLAENDGKLKDLQGQIEMIKERVETVKGLYRRRTIASKLLADIKGIISADPKMNIANNDLRYLWLSSLRFSANGRMEMSGYAAAPNRDEAMRIYADMLKRFRSYSPKKMPEKQELENIEAELKRRKAERKERLLEEPDNEALKQESPREIALNQRKAEIQELESGKIAVRQFIKFFRIGSLVLIEANWGDAPKGPAGAVWTPTKIYSFRITLALKPAGEDDEI